MRTDIQETEAELDRWAARRAARRASARAEQDAAQDVDRTLRAVAIVSVIFGLIAILAFTFTGCASSAVVHDLHGDWRLYERGTVPAPGYGPDGIAALHSLALSMDAGFDSIDPPAPVASGG